MKIRSFFSALLFLMLHGTLSLPAQSPIIYWKVDTSFANSQSVSRILVNTEGIFIAGIAQEKGNVNTHLTLTRLTHRGKLQLTQIQHDSHGFVGVSRMLATGEQTFRIFGTSLNEAGVNAPYICTVPCDFSTSSHNSIFLVNPTIMGDAADLGNGDCVWSKAVQGSTSQLYNIYVYRSDKNDIDRFRWKKQLQSPFHTECSRIRVLPDSNILLLARMIIPQLRDSGQAELRSLIYKISPGGQVLWSRETRKSGFWQQDLCPHSDTTVLLMNSYVLIPEKATYTEISVLDTSGSIRFVTRIDSMNASGILPMKNGLFCLYGACQYRQQNTLYSKGKVVLLNAQLQQVWSYTLGPSDKPDTDLEGKISLSEFHAAAELPNGNLICGGYVNMPDDLKSGTGYSRTWNNRNFLVFFQPKLKK